MANVVSLKLEDERMVEMREAPNPMVHLCLM